MKALVTGANGLIGNHLVRALISAGYPVRAMVRRSSDVRSLAGVDAEIVYGDILRPESLSAAMSGCTWVFHVAGVFAYGGRRSGDLIREAVAGVEHVLAAAAQTGVRRLMLTSSSVTVGSTPEKKVLTEARPGQFGPFDPPYVQAKVQQEQRAFELAAEYGTDLVAVCPTLTVGPRDYGLTESNQMIVNYWKDAYKTTWIGGGNIVAAADVARGHLLLAEKGSPGEKYLLGSDNLEWAELHALLSELTGLPGPHLKVYHTGAYLAAVAQELWSALSGEAPLTTREQANMVGRYYWYDHSKAARLGYRPKPSRLALAEAVSWLVAGEHVPADLRARMKLADVIYELRNAPKP